MPWIRVLFVAVFGLFVVNANGAQAPQTQTTIFDLPADTPGLMKDSNGNLILQKKTVCGQTKECVHVVVPGSEAATGYLHGYTYGYVEGFETTRDYVKARNEKEKQKDALSAAIKYDGNIYFPADGAQPTTEEAVKYSCANVKDDAITDWYMRIFGIIPFQNKDNPNDADYIKAGWDNNQNPNAQRIISFDISVDNTMVNDPAIYGNQISRKDLFKREFRKIASNPVGRVLLYRILIEIRRVDQNGKGCVDKNVLKQMPVILNARNSNRTITVRFGNASFRAGMYIAIESEDDDRGVISNNKCNDSIEIIRYMRNIDCDLFHEILHWFHCLRDCKRYNLDVEKFNCNDFPKSFKIGSNIVVPGTYEDKTKYDIDIAHYYYRDVWNQLSTDVAMKKISARVWTPSYEEMRTILGVPDKYSKHFKNGDDLSENLYRLSSNQPIRFGHVKLKAHQYFEDASVIEKYIKCLLSISSTFLIDKNKLFLPDIEIKKGLGGGKIIVFKKK